MRAAGRILLLLLCTVQPVYSQDKYQVDLSDLEKEVEQTAGKPYQPRRLPWSSSPFSLESIGVPAFSQLNFDLKRSGNTFMQYNLGLRLDGSYKKDMFSVFFQTDTLVQNQLQGWQEETKLLQGLIGLRPSPNFSLEAGNKVFRWGKGYACSPVAFIDRQKYPEDPEELREGFTIFTADWNQSFVGPLKNAALSAVGVPVYEHVNTQFGELNHINFASKLYLLLYDTDIDFMVLTV